jgi:hypothetical protein
MELDLTVAASAEHASVPIDDAMSQSDMPDAEEDAKPVHEVRAAPDEGSKKERKPRKRTAGVVEQLMQREPLSRPEGWPEPVIPEISMTPSSEAIRRRQAKRLSEGAQLPRSERWKRRLHPASR